MVYRQPFPGPGLGVRCPGAITRDRLEAVRESDAILREEFEKNGLEGKIWQYFTVVPDFRSTGIKDGKRAFEWCCIVRAVCTTDVMTATVAEGFLVSLVICFLYSGIGRVTVTGSCSSAGMIFCIRSSVVNLRLEVLMQG